MDWDEVGGTETLLLTADRHLLRRDIAELQPGDVILFRMRSDAVAKHLGICSGLAPFPTFIHAYANHGVVESALSEPWQRRIAAVFAFPGTH